MQDKEVAAAVYHNLRVLMEEPDKDGFEELLQETVEQLKATDETDEFEKYFTKFYLSRKEQWAACYRTGSGINTNMYVESFHRLIKYIYMRGRSNRRIDKLLHILMKVATDKAFERLCKLEKGKISRRLTVIRRRHVESNKLSQESVTQWSETKWTVLSSDGTQNYTVIRDTEKCPANCQLQCKDCNICIHSFSCNCMDALVNHTICKQIHLVARNKPIYQCPDSNTNTCMLSGADLLLNETHTSQLETVAPYHQEEAPTYDLNV